MTFGNCSWKLVRVLLAGSVVSCSGVKVDNNDDTELLRRRERRDEGMGKLFGDDTFLFGGEAGRRKEEPGSSIAVNTWLWRACLETISFMPLKSADPFGGVILTDWHSPRETPGERIKVDIRILDRELHTNGLKVSAFRQKYDKGQWIDVPVHPMTAERLEDTILTRAREMKANAGR